MKMITLYFSYHHLDNYASTDKHIIIIIIINLRLHCSATQPSPLMTT